MASSWKGVLNAKQATRHYSKVLEPILEVIGLAEVRWLWHRVKISRIKEIPIKRIRPVRCVGKSGLVTVCCFVHWSPWMVYR